MKKIFVAICICLALSLFVSCISMEMTPTELIKKDVVYIYEFKDLAANDIYKFSKLWVSETYKSAESVITFEDAELMTLKGNAISSVQVSGDFYRREFSYSISIEVKESKARIMFSNIESHSYYAGGSSIPGVNLRYLTYYDAVHEHFDSLSSTYEATVKKGLKSDW